MKPRRSKIRVFHRYRNVYIFIHSKFIISNVFSFRNFASEKFSAHLFVNFNWISFRCLWKYRLSFSRERKQFFPLPFELSKRSGLPASQSRKCFGYLAERKRASRYNFFRKLPHSKLNRQKGIHIQLLTSEDEMNFYQKNKLIVYKIFQLPSIWKL